MLVDEHNFFKFSIFTCIEKNKRRYIITSIEVFCELMCIYGGWSVIPSRKRKFIWDFFIV